MTDAEPLRTLNLTLYAATLTIEPSTAFSHYPYAVMGLYRGVRYPERFCATEQEAHEYLDRVRDAYETELKAYVRQK